MEGETGDGTWRLLLITSTGLELGSGRGGATSLRAGYLSSLITGATGTKIWYRQAIGGGGSRGGELLRTP